MTGEVRTHYQLGGAMLLAKFVEHAVAGQTGMSVTGPAACAPKWLAADGAHKTLTEKEFLDLAPRLRRQEIIHSLISVNRYPTTPNSNKKDWTLRVEAERGYSGPDSGEPEIRIAYADCGDADIIVLDDTGNHFRGGSECNPWPTFARSSGPQPLIIHKLHRPLPSANQTDTLWGAVATACSESRVVLVTADDLRHADVPISLGLSWERTALDIVWQMLNFHGFAALRDSPWVVVRLGVDGALLWRSAPAIDGKREYKAWLVYDANAIEGSFVGDIRGGMTGSGAAFTAAFTASLGQAELLNEDALMLAAKKGLFAARRIFTLGFGRTEATAAYPGPELFADSAGAEKAFASSAVPIIPETLVPDRGCWRLLDVHLGGKRHLLHRAVIQLATGSNAPTEKKDSSAVGRTERDAAQALGQCPCAKFGKLSTYDRLEMENYRFLHTLLKDYLSAKEVARPLSFAVFGPPGAGKSFGVKEVAASLKGLKGCRPVETKTFNLSLFGKPEELAAAFHLVRDSVLKGNVPLVFFDEFDTALDGQPLAWLRHFLSPMQDGEFLDRGAPHPIGQAIFVFAGGTCSTFAEFNTHPGLKEEEFRQKKGPDFLSRLRATLDIPSLNLLTAHLPGVDLDHPPARRSQPAGTFNPFGPIESIPCEAAVLLRRAAILGFGVRNKAPELLRSDDSLDVRPGVLRALLFLPGCAHGNRSFEALLDMSHLSGAKAYTPSLLPAPFQIPLHADAVHLGQLVGESYPFPHDEREVMAAEIHRRYLRLNQDEIEKRPHEAACAPNYSDLSEEDKESNRGQADDVAAKLRSVGLWFRKRLVTSDSAIAPSVENGKSLLAPFIERLARAEHDRWVAQKRRAGWVPAVNLDRENRSNAARVHNYLFSWEQLDERARELDLSPVRDIPEVLALAGYEIITSRTGLEPNV